VAVSNNTFEMQHHSAQPVVPQEQHVHSDACCVLKKQSKKKVIEIKEFKLEMIKPGDHYNFFYAGRRQCGKSVVMRSIVQHRAQPDDNKALVFYPADEKAKFWKGFFAADRAQFIRNESFPYGLSDDQKQYPSTIVLEQIMYLEKVCRSFQFRNLIMNNRQMKSDVHLSLSELSDLKPVLRQQGDYIFIFAHHTQDRKLQLYQHFGSACFDSFQEFDEAFGLCTQNYGCMVFDLTAKPVQVYWYRADPNPDWLVL